MMKPLNIFGKSLIAKLATEHLGVHLLSFRHELKVVF
jgi:hypothetical protein